MDKERFDKGLAKRKEALGAGYLEGVPAEEPPR